MAGYKYYNQRNYPNIPYPSPSNKKATVKSGGCGVCCGAMVIANLLHENVNIEQFARFCIKNGARVSGGTDMLRLGRLLERDYGLNFATTNDTTVFVDHLRRGGIAIANVSGNRKGYIGIFSDSGHYVVVPAIEGERLTVLDPALYAGKYEIVGRRGKVIVDGNTCYCKLAVLVDDVKGRNPEYYLFSRKGDNMAENDVPQWQIDACLEVCERRNLDKDYWLPKVKSGGSPTYGELFGLLNKM